MRGAICLSFSRNQRGIARASLALAVLAGLVAGCGTGKVTQPASGGPADATVIAQPVLGYIWDSNRAGLRSLIGVPGASRMDSVVLGGGVFSSAVPCVQKSYALLTNAAGAVFVMSLPQGQPAQVTTRISRKQQVLISPSCSQALIYAPDAAGALLISGLPSKPTVRSLSVSHSGSILGAAVGDMGAVLLATARQDGSAALQILASPTWQAAQFGGMQRYGAMVFVPGGDTALLADSGANTVTVVSHASGNPGFLQAASSSDGVSRPVALAGSADGQLVFVANSSGAPLLRVDLSGTSPPLKIQCSCTPTELLPLSGNATFQLNDPASGTIYALDADAITPRTVFLPSDISASHTGAAK